MSVKTYTQFFILFFTHLTIQFITCLVFGTPASNSGINCQTASQYFYVELSCYGNQIIYIDHAWNDTVRTCNNPTGSIPQLYSQCNGLSKCRIERTGSSIYIHVVYHCKAQNSTTNLPTSATIFSTTRQPIYSTTDSPKSSTIIQPISLTTRLLLSSTTRLSISTKTRLPTSTTHLPTSTNHLPTSTNHLPTSTNHLPTSKAHLPTSTTHSLTSTNLLTSKTRLPKSTTYSPTSRTHLPTSKTRLSTLTTHSLTSTNLSTSKTHLPKSTTNSPTSTKSTYSPTPSTRLPIFSTSHLSILSTTLLLLSGISNSISTKFQSNGYTHSTVLHRTETDKFAVGAIVGAISGALFVVSLLLLMLLIRYIYYKRKKMTENRKPDERNENSASKHQMHEKTSMKSQQ